MKIIALKERAEHEKRSALIPENIKLLINNLGFEVFVECNIGKELGIEDKDYSEVGAKIFDVSDTKILKDAQILCKLRPTPINNKFQELNYMSEGSFVLGMFSYYLDKSYINYANDRGINILSMNYLPRISRLQNADSLSSQNNLLGYRSVIEAAYLYNRSIPMMMSAAGTIIAAKVLVLGVGVAGLQAIATAKRLGALVFAYDIRYTTKEQVESLGAKFLHPGSLADAEKDSGYAKALDDSSSKIQEDFLSEIISDFDIIITTAQIQEKKAPILISKKVFEKVKPGSIIIDTAIETGGNVEFAQKNNIIYKNGVRIFAYTDLVSRVGFDASKLYSKNIYYFLQNHIKESKLNMESEIVQKMLLSSVKNP